MKTLIEKAMQTTEENHYSPANNSGESSYNIRCLRCEKAINLGVPHTCETSTTTGLKHDQEKPALAYIPYAAVKAEGEAFSFGAKKYEAWNYANGIKVSRTISAALRHIYQFLAGEDKDSESGVHHLGSARANLAMALDSLERYGAKFDDRFKK